MVGTGHCIFFLDAMNGLSRKRSRTWIYGGETETEKRGFRIQMIAQITVFSFLQKMTHPLLDHFFVPCIAAFIKEIKIYFYDRKNDVHCWIVEECTCSLIFLEQKCQPLNYEATLAVLLVVNYRFLCCGLHKPLLKVLEVRFCEHAGSCIDLYKKKLSIKMSDHRKLLPSMILLISWSQTLFSH